jgi:hypothetical protein
MTTRDNRDILRYRGVLSPGETITSAQTTAFKVAVLNIQRLNTNIYAQYSTDKSDSTSKQVASNPFMRLLPEIAPLGDQTVYDFYFPFAPQGIQYSDLSDEISEIPRAGTLPLVVFKSHKLMRVSFEFLVAVPYDGMTIDVEESLSILRFFSTNSHRGIVFFNFDTMLTSPWQYRRGPSARPLQFNIAEMSVTARQRNSLGKITQAIVNITLVENQNPIITVAKVPPIRKRREKKKCRGPKCKTETKTTTVPSYSSNANTVAGQIQTGYLTRGVITIPS